MLPPVGRVWEPGEPRVFTIFGHGTGGHRHGRGGEIISELGAAYWDRGESNEPNAYYDEHYQRTFLILDGVGDSFSQVAPGGAPLGLATEADPEHPMPGDFWPDTVYKPLKPEPNRVSNMVLAKTLWTAHRGELMGDGWEDNVVHALYVLGRLKDAGQFPEVINFFGWSRGACTGIMLANAIDTYFVKGEPYTVQVDYMLGYDPDNMTVALPARVDLVSVDEIEINLFLIDPVPGRFGGDGETFGAKRSIERFAPNEIRYQQLPGIVRHCVITLANDEQREGFAPLDADDIEILDPDRTQVVWLPFPGIHDTQARLTPYQDFAAPDGGWSGRFDPSTDGEAPTAVPRVAWDLVLRFLTNSGSRFQGDVFADPRIGGRFLTNDEIVELYTEKWLLKKRYHSIRNRGVENRVMGGLMPRLYTGYPFAGREYFSFNPIQYDRDRLDLFTAAFGIYVESPGFFINEHHRACFADAYPATYRFLRGPGVVGVVSRDMQQELAQLAADAQVLQQLEQLGLQHHSTEYSVSEGFRFGDHLGEPLRHDDPPLPARFTGMLNEMGLVTSQPEDSTVRNESRLEERAMRGDRR